MPSLNIEESPFTCFCTTRGKWASFFCPFSQLSFKCAQRSWCSGSDFPGSQRWVRITIKVVVQRELLHEDNLGAHWQVVWGFLIPWLVCTFCLHDRVLGFYLTAPAFLKYCWVFSANFYPTEFLGTSHAHHISPKIFDFSWHSSNVSNGISVPVIHRLKNVPDWFSLTKLELRQHIPLLGNLIRVEEEGVDHQKFQWLFSLRLVIEHLNPQLTGCIV